MEYLVFHQEEFTVEVNYELFGKRIVLVHSGAPLLGVTITQYGAHDAPIVSLPHHSRTFTNMVEADQLHNNLGLAISITNNWPSFWNIILQDAQTEPEEDCVMNVSHNLSFWVNLGRRGTTEFRYMTDDLYIDGFFKNEGKSFQFRIGLSPEELINSVEKATPDGGTDIATLPHGYVQKDEEKIGVIIALTCAIAREFEDFAKDAATFIHLVMLEQQNRNNFIDPQLA